MAKNDKHISDSQERAEKIFLDEAVENMHNEQLIQFWAKYKYLLIGCVVAIILSVAGWQAYQAHKQRTLLADSDIYEQAVILNAKGQTQEALQAYEQLKASHTNYKYLSMMRRAAILMETDKKDQGLELLLSVYQDQSAPEVLRTIAMFGYVYRQIDTKDPQELQQMIAPYLTASNPWYGAAVELQVQFLMRQQKTQEAISLIDQALTVSSLTAQEKEHLTVWKKTLTDM